MYVSPSPALITGSGKFCSRNQFDITVNSNNLNHFCLYMAILRVMLQEFRGPLLPQAWEGIGRP